MVKPDGNKRDHYRYDAFGKPAPGNSKLSEDGRIVNHNTFGYTGEMWDQEAELLYLRARYYEPETGRFLSRDSYWGQLESPLSKHLYAYVGNNPVNYVDPTGNIRLYINNQSVGDAEIRNGKAYVDISTLASKFGLWYRHERDRNNNPTKSWTVTNWIKSKSYTTSDGKMWISTFAKDWGLVLSYSKFENAIYLTKPQTYVTKDKLEKLFKDFGHFQAGKVTDDLINSLNYTIEKYIVAGCTDNKKIKIRIRHFLT